MTNVIQLEKERMQTLHDVIDRAYVLLLNAEGFEDKVWAHVKTLCAPSWRGAVFYHEIDKLVACLIQLRQSAPDEVIKLWAEEARGFLSDR